LVSVRLVLGLIKTLWGTACCLSHFFLLILRSKEAHILVRNVTPNEISSNWDLPLGIVPYFLEMSFGLVGRNDAIRKDK